MYRMNFKLTLPTLILEPLEQEPSHGYRIAQRIKERSQGVLDFKEGPCIPPFISWRMRAWWRRSRKWKRAGRGATTASPKRGVRYWQRTGRNGGSFHEP